MLLQILHDAKLSENLHTAESATINGEVDQQAIINMQRKGFRKEFVSRFRAFSMK